MKIEVISYQSEWPRFFEELRRAAVEALAGIDVAVEHVGSTSVPGLAAKPVIDIDIILPQWERFGEVVRRLGTLGFEHRGDLGLVLREQSVRVFARDQMDCIAHVEQTFHRVVIAAVRAQSVCLLSGDSGT